MKIQKEIIINNQKCLDMYTKIFQDNDNVMLSSALDIKNYHQGELNQNKRIDIVDIYFADLPESISNYFLNGEKIIKIKCKHYFEIFEDDMIKIKTKYTPINNIIMKVLNKLRVIKVKNLVTFQQVGEECKVNIETKISSYVGSPLKETIENYCYQVCNITIDKSFDYFVNSNI